MAKKKSRTSRATSHDGRAVARKFGDAKRTARGRFTVEAGRGIYFDGRLFISIGRADDTRPVDADAVTHFIAAFLNRKGMAPNEFYEERKRAGW